MAWWMIRFGSAVVEVVESTRGHVSAEPSHLTRVGDWWSDQTKCHPRYVDVRVGIREIVRTVGFADPVLFRLCSPFGHGGPILNQLHAALTA